MIRIGPIRLNICFRPKLRIYADFYLPNFREQRDYDCHHDYFMDGTWRLLLVIGTVRGLSGSIRKWPKAMPFIAFFWRPWNTKGVSLWWNEATQSHSSEMPVFYKNGVFFPVQ